MTWQELKSRIESDEFAVRLGVASGRSVFRRALTNSREIRDLVRLLRADKTVSRLVVARITALAETDIDYRYENPFDIALAAYLLALEIADPDLALPAAEILLRVPLTWWARDLALSILQDSDHQERVATTYATAAFDVPRPSRAARSAESEKSNELAVHGIGVRNRNLTRIIRSWEVSSATSVSSAKDSRREKTRFAESRSSERESGTQEIFVREVA